MNRPILRTMTMLVLFAAAGAGPGFSATGEDGVINQYRIVGGPSAGSSGMREVVFTFLPPSSSEKVCLAGTFNNWSPDVEPMDGPESDGTFRLTLTLGAGEYLYKFVADGNWHHDPENEQTADDGFGGFNSKLLVDGSYPEVAIETGDGKIRGGDLSLENGGATLVRTEPERIVVTARAWQGDVEEARILFRHRGEETFLPMRQLGGDGRFTYFRGDLSIPFDTEGRLGIVLKDGEAEMVMTRSGLREMAGDADLLEVGPIETPLFDMPDWVVDGVFYQIFPERFRNGNEKNDPDFSEWYYEGKTTLPPEGKTNGEYYHRTADWSDVAGLTVSPYRTDGRPDYFSFYGGDLEGVTEMIPYLVDLGVTILYFNPLQTGKSNHKYDACDYREVDPHFGGNAAFRKLVDEAHEAGIRIVVDGVFNHTGNCHYAFEDCRKKGKESLYWPWYEWRRWPLPENMGDGEKESDYYDCWWGFGDLPNVNFDLSRPNPNEQKALRISEADPNWPVIEEIRAAIGFWLDEMDADGFRLDVANEVPSWFWKLFREEVRRVKPDGYVISELWGDAGNDLSPLRFDATMNYKYFREPCLSFFGRDAIDAAAFDMQIAGGRFGYPLPSALGAMNLLGSHDTERFLTLAGGETRRLLLALLFSSTYVGVPHLYYGDEIGMEGGRDPDCRRPFEWDRLEEPSSKALRERIGDYLALRHEHTALRRGDFRTLLAEDRVYAFTRWNEEDRLAVLLNAGADEAEITFGPGSLPFEQDRVRDALSGEEIPAEGDSISVRLPPLSGMVLQFPLTPPEAPEAPEGGDD